MKILQLNDNVYCTQYSVINHIEKIVRITTTHAVTNNGTKLKINISDNGYCHQIAAGKFNSKSYFLETEELKQEFKKQILVNKFSKFCFKILDLDSLTKINEILCK